jgi:hypothetical protein
MIRRQKLVFMVVACALVVLIAGMIPLNYVHKLSHGCPFSHKVKAKVNPCLHDSVTSSSDLAGIFGPPASSPVGPKQLPICTIQASDFYSPTVNTLIEDPPLRC